MRGPGVWLGGGFSPLRLDREAVIRRAGDVPAWVADELLDAFEPEAVKSLNAAAKRRRKSEGDN